MQVGVPKEIKDNEFRVGLTPSSVAELVHHGHQVMVETGAGAGSGLPDAEYVAAGATMIADAASIFASADMIVKVKEPLASERVRMLRPGPGAVHLSAPRRRTWSRRRDLIASGATCIAYETVTAPDRRAAVADADVGSGRPAGAAGRRALPRNAKRAGAASCSAACRACRRRK